MSYLPYNILVTWSTPEDTSDIDTIEIYKGSKIRTCDRIIATTKPIYVTNVISNGTYIDQLNAVGEFQYIAIARNKVSYTKCNTKFFKVYPDSDGDGIPDDEDIYPYDFDNDGIPDIMDSDYGLNYLKLDTDGDGITNDYDPDDDNDGVLDEDDPFPLFYNRQLIVAHGDGSTRFTGIYPDGGEIQLRAAANDTDDLEFKYWDGDEVTDKFDPHSTVIMDRDKLITGNFGLITYDLSLVGFHKETEQEPVAGSLNFIGEGGYKRDEIIEFELEVVDPCLQFVEWSGAAVYDKFSQKTKIRMDEDKELTAIVETPIYQITVKTIGYGDSRDGQIVYDQMHPCGELVDINIPDPGNRYLVESIDDSSGKLVDGGSYSFQATEDRTDLLVRVFLDNEPPIANKDPRAVGRKGGSIIIDVKSNDFDPDGDPLTIIIVSAPIHGTAIVTDANGNPNPNGSHIKYQHNDSFDMVDQFEYKVNDGTSDSNTTTVEIGVGVSRGDVTSFSAGAGLYDIPLVLGTDAVEVHCHFDAYNLPDRFQIFFNPDGPTEPGNPAHLVAESLYVGDSLIGGGTYGVGTFNLTRFIYVGAGGDAVGGKFSSQGNVTVTNDASKSARGSWGNRSNSSPNGPGQIGVKNRTMVRPGGASFKKNLNKADGNICISYTKPQSTNFVAYIRSEAPGAGTAWDLNGIEFF